MFHNKRITLKQVAVVYLAIFVQIAIGKIDIGTSDDPVTVLEVQAVVGRVADLPCDLEPKSSEDHVYMVLWFHHPEGLPLYSFDVRGRSFNSGLHWSDPTWFGKRGYFITDAHPAFLNIHDVLLDDEGLYRCRVDYKNSPTKNFLIRLSVIVPPHQMLLYDEEGRDLGGKVGPLKEGGNFTIICELRGGRPKPKLIWMLNEMPVANHTILKNNRKVIISKLTMTGVKKSLLHSVVRCMAIDIPLLRPYERKATIEMYFHPTSVKIITKLKKVQANTELFVECVVEGSRPEPLVIWFSNNIQISVGKHIESSNATMTVSQLRLLPQPEDDGAILSCHGENTQLGFFLIDTIKLAVIHKPVVSLMMGSVFDPNLIKEGDDVFIECSVLSKPRDYRIFWEKDGTKINETSSPRIITSASSLVIRKVTRLDEAGYVCLASNVLGLSRSQVLYVRVQYTPVCAETSPVLVGARLGEEVHVICSVHANPAEVDFVWQIRSSGKKFKVSASKLVMSGTKSVLRYRAATTSDFGLLYCWGTNTIGTQKEPCVFRVVPATNPSTPTNCTTTKVPGTTAGSKMLSVRCLAGSDGGMAQYFSLNAISHRERIVYNHSVAQNDGAVWLNVSWSALETVMDHEILAVVAQNVKGPSLPFMLSDLDLNAVDPPKQTDGIKYKNIQRVRYMAVLLAILALIFIIVYAVKCCWSSSVPITQPGPQPKSPRQAVVKFDPDTQTVNTYPIEVLDSDDEPQPPRVIPETKYVATDQPGTSSQEYIPMVLPDEQLVFGRVICCVESATHNFCPFYVNKYVPELNYLDHHL